jgi:nitroreductase
MDLADAICGRRTANGHLRPDPVRTEDQRRLMDAASRAPSHFNSQPWRFLLIEDRSTIAHIAAVSGASMADLMEQGTFWKRYLRYFRFSQDEMDIAGDGIHVDRMPRALRAFRRHLFGDTGQALMNKLGVPATLGADNQVLVAGSPLLLGALLDRSEYVPGQLSAIYSLIGLGAAIENIWLTTTELGMGMQFVSTPMEFPERWAELSRLLEVPADLELMALFRLGYLDPRAERPAIDWTSSRRKRFDQFVFRDRCSSAAFDLDDLDEASTR